MKNFVYVDAENVAYPDFKRYFESKLRNTVVNGKAYGSKDVVGEYRTDYIRLGFNFVDTSEFNSTSKNVADMKILTDCAFDVAELSSIRDVHVTLITKDCDFLPLVLKLLGAGIVVDTPFMGLDQRVHVSMSAITQALQDNGYNPFDSDLWMEPQIPVLRDVLACDFTFRQVAGYCNRKRAKFTHEIAAQNQLLAAAMEQIPEEQFGLRTVFYEMRKANCSIETMIENIKIYTGKYFGVTLKDDDIRRGMSRMY